MFNLSEIYMFNLSERSCLVQECLRTREWQPFFHTKICFIYFNMANIIKMSKYNIKPQENEIIYQHQVDN